MKSKPFPPYQKTPVNLRDIWNDTMFITFQACMVVIMAMLFLQLCRLP